MPAMLPATARTTTPVRRGVPKALLDRVHLAALQQVAEARLGRLDGGLVELAALEQVDVLAADRRQFLAQLRLAVPPGQQQDRRPCHGTSTVSRATRSVSG